jgi:hypothetical protein
MLVLKLASHWGQTKCDFEPLNATQIKAKAAIINPIELPGFMSALHIFT